MAPDYRSEDAFQLFQPVGREKKYVNAMLTKIHDEFSAKNLTEHPPRNIESGDRFWLKIIRKPGESKLDCLPVGPAEILGSLSAGRYRIAGPYDETQVESLRLTPYNPRLTPGAPPLQFYTDKETLGQSEFLK